jgi:hypothetical protein
VGSCDGGSVGVSEDGIRVVGASVGASVGGTEGISLGVMDDGARVVGT